MHTATAQAFANIALVSYPKGTQVMAQTRLNLPPTGKNA